MSEYVHFPSTESKGRLLCINGRDRSDSARNSYALALQDALPASATTVDCHTYVSDTICDYHNVWHALSAMMPMVGWYQRKGCTVPARCTTGGSSGSRWCQNTHGGHLRPRRRQHRHQVVVLRGGGGVPPAPPILSHLLLPLFPMSSFPPPNLLPVPCRCFLVLSPKGHSILELIFRKKKPQHFFISRFLLKIPICLYSAPALLNTVMPPFYFYLLY